jgi:hypothetical protein
MTKTLVALLAFGVIALMPAQAQVPGVDPAFIGSLAKELGGATTSQAEGAAGAIFGLAKSRLPAADFAKVATAVPGMDGLLKAAPAMAAAGAGGAAAAAAGGMSGLGSLAGSFSKLGLKPDMVAKAIPIVTNYVTKSGGAEVGKLLMGVLK